MLIAAMHKLCQAYTRFGAGAEALKLRRSCSNPVDSRAAFARSDRSLTMTRHEAGLRSRQIYPPLARQKLAIDTRIANQHLQPLP